MGITSSLVTALSGLSTAQSQIDVVGNNIANVNTVGFKSSRLDFKTQFLENFSFGSAPNGSLGGTNPLQIGLGVSSGSMTKNFSNGGLKVTGLQTNIKSATGSRRPMQTADPSGAWKIAAVRIFGVQAAFNGMAARFETLPAQRLSHGRQ